jgi:hypothetical protein
MPYTIKKVKGGYKVRGPSGYKSKKPLSKARARAQQKALREFETLGPGQVGCLSCGSRYVTWLNYKQVLKALEKRP